MDNIDEAIAAAEAKESDRPDDPPASVPSLTVMFDAHGGMQVATDGVTLAQLWAASVLLRNMGDGLWADQQRANAQRQAEAQRVRNMLAMERGGLS